MPKVDWVSDHYTLMKPPVVAALTEEPQTARQIYDKVKVGSLETVRVILRLMVNEGVLMMKAEPVARGGSRNLYWWKWPTKQKQPE